MTLGPAGRKAPIREQEFRIGKFFEYTVHILAYNSIIKADSAAAAGAYGGLNCCTRRHYFKHAYIRNKNYIGADRKAHMYAERTRSPTHAK